MPRGFLAFAELAESLGEQLVRIALGTREHQARAEVQRVAQE